MPGAPCVRCDERRVGCHAECERYLTWSAEQRAAREKDHDNRMVDRYEQDRRIRISKHKARRRARGRKG